MKGKKITAIIFTIIIGSMMCLLLASGFLKDFVTDYRNTVPKGTPVLERVTEAIDIFEALIVEQTPFHDKFIEVYGASLIAMGKKTLPDPNYNYLYKTKEGQITYLVNERETEAFSEKITALKESLEKENIPFLYVQAPFKLMDDKDITPLEFNYSTENTNTFLKALEENNVSTLDLRPYFRTLKEEGAPISSLFYNTDHHWTIESSLYATSIIAHTLVEEYNVDLNLPLLSKDSFTFETKDKSFIGSLGRRTGKVYAGTDSFTLVLPSYETDIVVYETDYGITTEKRGPFSESVLVKSYLEDKSLTSNRYAAYHGDNEELAFINNKNEGGKVLIIKDSFGLPVYSFMSLSAREVRAIDPRLYKGSISSYAKMYNPDIVIFLYNEDSLNKNMFLWE